MGLIADILGLLSTLFVVAIGLIVAFLMVVFVFDVVQTKDAIESAHRSLGVVQPSGERPVDRVVYQRRLARAGNSGYDCEQTEGYADREILQVVFTTIFEDQGLLAQWPSARRHGDLASSR